MAETSDKPPTKSDLVLAAIKAGIPSYVAWDMTVAELKEALPDG